MNPLGLILDLVITGLLVATILYAIRLNGRLAVLRDNKAELEDLVRGFAEATERAEAGIQGMRRTVSESGEALQKSLDQAKAIRDELQFMVEAADSLANRLESAIGNQRAAARAAEPLTATRPGESSRRPATEPPAATSAPAQPEARSRAERELMKALESLQ